MRNRRCKIVATVGPASASPPMLEMLHETGVDLYRLNFSHGSHEDHGRVAAAIRNIEARTGRMIGVMADLQGPKIRVGRFEGGAIELKHGQIVRIDAADAPGGPGRISLPHAELIGAASPGAVLMLDDGKLQLTVTRKLSDAALEARVDVGGVLKERKGVNVVGATLPISALTAKDLDDLEFALAQGVDYIALSFVQRPEDVDEAREKIAGRAALIVKLEKPSAIDAMEQIIARTDAVMVARGDLGVELPPERVPIEQRRIIRCCRAAGKPVIVATHMLESMIESPTPTRAEASDVANAVYQGADAVMLSAESAVGRHPAAVVAIMDRLIATAEQDPYYWRQLAAETPTPEHTTADAISLSARNISEVLECVAVVAFTTTGSTALRISRDRPPAIIIGLTPEPAIARRLLLAWGVNPVVTSDVETFDDMVAKAESIAQATAGARDGDRIVITAGYPFGRPGKTNTLKISRIGAGD